MENLVLTGRMAGKISRGRQREKLLNCMAIWLKGSDKDMMSCMGDGWRATIENANRNGTQ